jgi:hypothetical protein
MISVLGWILPAGFILSPLIGLSIQKLGMKYVQTKKEKPIKLLPALLRKSFFVCHVLGTTWTVMLLLLDKSLPFLSLNWYYPLFVIFMLHRGYFYSLYAIYLVER